MFSNPITNYIPPADATFETRPYKLHKLDSGPSDSATVDREECHTVSKHDMDLPDIEHSNKEDEHWHSLPR